MEPLGVRDPREAGPYRLVGRLGGGAMGAVYLGRAGARALAVKVVHPELAEDAGFRARFGREIEAARAVSGAFTAPVVDADAHARQPWLATAFIPGVSLADAVARHGALDEAALRILGAGLAEALADIHRAGITHRDLKPSNVLLAADGPHVLDFGISRAADASALTESDVVLGSAPYMAPEQALGQVAGPAADIFSLAATLTYAGTGSGPFGQGPALAVIYRVISLEPDLSEVPGSLAPLLSACLAKDPSDRPNLAQVTSALSTAGPVPDAAWLPAGYLADIAAAAAVLTTAPEPPRLPSPEPEPSATTTGPAVTRPLQNPAPPDAPQPRHPTPLHRDPADRGSGAPPANTEDLRSDYEKAGGFWVLLTGGTALAVITWLVTMWSEPDGPAGFWLFCVSWLGWCGPLLLGGAISALFRRPRGRESELPPDYLRLEQRSDLRPHDRF